MRNIMLLLKALFLLTVILLASCQAINHTEPAGLQKTATEATQVLDKTSTGSLFKNTNEFENHPIETITPTYAAKTTSDVKEVVLCHQVPQPSLEKSTNMSDSVFLSGHFVLCALEANQSAFDFDNGDLMGPNNLKSDIILEVGKTTLDNNMYYYLREINDSMVNEPDEPIPSHHPTYSECKERALLKKRWHHIMGVQGHAGCVLTNEGRVSYFEVTQVDAFGAESIDINFITWDYQ